MKGIEYECECGNKKVLPYELIEISQKLNAVIGTGQICFDCMRKHKIIIEDGNIEIIKVNIGEFLHWMNKCNEIIITNLFTPFFYRLIPESEIEDNKLKEVSINEA